MGEQPYVDTQELLTVDELASLLKVPRSWIYGRTRRRGADRLPYVKLGKYVRFETGVVQAWLTRRRQQCQDFPEWLPHEE